LRLGEFSPKIRSMIDIDTLFPTGKLKTVPLNEIQNAISEALLKLIGENNPMHKLSVSITSLEFKDYMGARMVLTLSSILESEAEKEATADIASV